MRPRSAKRKRLLKRKVSSRLYDFIRLNLEFSRLTEGWFDFTVGPLVKLWDILARDPRAPEEKELRQAAGKVGCQHVHTEEESRGIVFDVPGMVLDPGASGKGYALGTVADFLQANQVRHAVLDFGGNLFVIGQKPSEGGRTKPWRAGIRHPDKEHFLGSVKLDGRGIATSSWYEHCFRKEGTIYHHLLDPHTGRPGETDISSVSVLSSKAVYTDFLSTAFFVMGVQKGRMLAERLKPHGIDADYVVLKKDGSLSASKGAEFSP